MDKLDTLPTGRFGVRPNRLSDRSVTYDVLFYSDECDPVEVANPIDRNTAVELCDTLNRALGVVAFIAC